MRSFLFTSISTMMVMMMMLLLDLAREASAFDVNMMCQTGSDVNKTHCGLLLSDWGKTADAYILDALNLCTMNSVGINPGLTRHIPTATTSNTMTSSLSSSSSSSYGGVRRGLRKSSLDSTVLGSEEIQTDAAAADVPPIQDQRQLANSCNGVCLTGGVCQACCYLYAFSYCASSCGCLCGKCSRRLEDELMDGFGHQDEPQHQRNLQSSSPITIGTTPPITLATTSPVVPTFYSNYDDVSSLKISKACTWVIRRVSRILSNQGNFCLGSNQTAIACYGSAFN